MKTKLIFILLCIHNISFAQKNEYVVFTSKPVSENVVSKGVTRWNSTTIDPEEFDYATSFYLKDLDKEYKFNFWYFNLKRDPRPSIIKPQAYLNTISYLDWDLQGSGFERDEVVDLCDKWEKADTLFFIDRNDFANGQIKLIPVHILRLRGIPKCDGNYCSRCGRYQYYSKVVAISEPCKICHCPLPSSTNIVDSCNAIHNISFAQKNEYVVFTSKPVSENVVSKGATRWNSTTLYPEEFEPAISFDLKNLDKEYKFDFWYRNLKKNPTPSIIKPQAYLNTISYLDWDLQGSGFERDEVVDLCDKWEKADTLFFIDRNDFANGQIKLLPVHIFRLRGIPKCDGNYCSRCGRYQYYSKVVAISEPCKICHCPLDCQRKLNGTAFYDACAVCVGGSTKKTACASPCSSAENVALLDSYINLNPSSTDIVDICDAIYNASVISPQASTLEYISVIQKSRSGEGSVRIGTPVTSSVSGGTKVYPVASDAAYATRGVVIRHSDSQSDALSLKDLYRLYTINKMNKEFIFWISINNGKQYDSGNQFAFIVKDAAKLNQFIASFPDATNSDEQGEPLKNSPLYAEYNAVKTYFKEKTFYPEADLRCLALASILISKDAGVMLCKRDRGLVEELRVMQTNEDGIIKYIKYKCF